MKIGIIGAGQIGGTLTRRLSQLGHEVFVANSRGPSALAGLAKETGAKAVTVQDAARASRVVIVTIPEAKIRNLPINLFEGVPGDVVVIDTGNYYPRERDGRIDEIEAGMQEPVGRDSAGPSRRQGFQYDELQTSARIRPSCRYSRTPRPAGRGRRPEGEASGAVADRAARI